MSTLLYSVKLWPGHGTNHRLIYFVACPNSEQQDIVVVLDSSTSITRPDFSKQLAFVNAIIEKVGIGPDANQVGIVSFSDNYRLNFHLNANR